MGEDVASAPRGPTAVRSVAAAVPLLGARLCFVLLPAANAEIRSASCVVRGRLGVSGFTYIAYWVFGASGGGGRGLALW